MKLLWVLVATGRWPLRHWQVTWVLATLAVVGFRVTHVWLPVLTASMALSALALTSGTWSTLAPASFERLVAGPWRRLSWRWWLHRAWPTLCRECGLSVHRRTQGQEKIWVHPRLVKVSVSADTLSARVRARVGQTVDDLEAAAPALGSAAAAVAWRTRASRPGELVIDLVMREVLDVTRTAVMPAAPLVEGIPIGRRQNGNPWALSLRGRHTLVVGCSGSGKGSVLWGVAGGLAPAAHCGVAQLWGIDLKRGVELAMGRSLFSTLATTPAEAVAVLTRLLSVVDLRGQAMAGSSRLHEPVPGDPLHVLVIDELAALTAYADTETKREASRLLSEILTQGRALGVVVMACVQDPRKETIGMRGLFTQTVALRLRSVEETKMVLGDGMAAVAPSHRISPSSPGCGWVVEDDGSTDRVRADYWPDSLVRAVAGRYPARTVEPIRVPIRAVGAGSLGGPQDAPQLQCAVRPRRTPRTAASGLDS